MYDIGNLKSADDCRTVMRRARERGAEDVYRAVFQPYCAIVGHANDDPADALVGDFYKTLAAYEQLLTEKNGSTTIASRTRQNRQQGRAPLARRVNAGKDRNQRISVAGRSWSAGVHRRISRREVC
jgi:hypothetical protein